MRKFSWSLGLGRGVTDDTGRLDGWSDWYVTSIGSGDDSDRGVDEWIGNNDSADDMKNVDLTRIHYLSGPFEIETAEPGDVLLVEIMDVQPHDKHPWGL